MLEIQFSGRGGQGVVSASQILGLAFFKAGQYPQCYSVFGGERRGAPVLSFLRVDREKILLKCEIRRPGELICLDDSLVDPEQIKTLLLPHGRILINTRQSADAFGGLQDFDLAVIDASAVSREIGLGSIINTTVLGAYCRFTGHIHLDVLLEAVAEMVPAKKEENMNAIRRAYGSMRVEKL